LLIHAGATMRWYTNNFFKYIKSEFNKKTLDLLNLFIKVTRANIQVNIRIRFLKACLNLNLTPAHLNIHNTYKKMLYCEDTKKRLDRINKRRTILVVKLQLNDAYRQLRVNRHEIYRISKLICDSLPVYLTCCFFNAQEKRINQIWGRETTRIDNKIELLIKRDQQKRIGNVPVQYYAEEKGSTTHIQLMSNMFKESHFIKIKPETNSITEFENYLDNKWFVNLSSVTIPTEMQQLLQLGDRFALPTMNSNLHNTIIEIIKQTENNIINLENISKNDVK